MKKSSQKISRLRYQAGVIALTLPFVESFLVTVRKKGEEKGKLSMKSTHQFQVKAPIESIYEKVLSAEGWLSFVPGYQGLESADPNWPHEGSSIIVRYRLLKLIKVTVVEHEPGHRFRTHEESTGGYVDNVDLTFHKEDGTTRLTFVNDTTQRSMLLRILFLLMYPLRLMLRELILWRRVKRRLRAMVET